MLVGDTVKLRGPPKAHVYRLIGETRDRHRLYPGMVTITGMCGDDGPIRSGALNGQSAAKAVMRRGSTP